LSANSDRGKDPESKTGSVRPEGRSAAAANHAPQELEGVIRNGVVELTNGKLPEGARVRVRVKRLP
jgi:hypothetical protein